MTKRKGERTLYDLILVCYTFRPIYMTFYFIYNRDMIISRRSQMESRKMFLQINKET